MARPALEGSTVDSNVAIPNKERKPPTPLEALGLAIGQAIVLAAGPQPVPEAK